MRRVIYDVPRWSIYLHRDARGLGPVEQHDPPVVQFEDELFERLHAGGAERLEDAAGDIAGWAEGVHAACDALPDFGRLASECRGDPLAAAVAVEKLMEQLGPRAQPAPPPEAELRRLLRGSCAQAAAAVDEAREAAEGLEQVAFGKHPGTGTSPGGPTQPGAARRLLAQRLKHDDRLRRVALLAGRFKRVAAAKHRAKVRHGCDELTDVEQGAALERLLPVELVKLVQPRLRLVAQRDLLERQCLQYALTGTETLGRGPLVVCLDKSGSMDGPPDVWATAVALALLELAQRERRPFALLGFDGAVKHESIVEVGGRLPEEALFVRCSGGTDVDRVLTRALDVIENHPGAMRRADVVLVTDGGSDSSQASLVRERAKALGATVLGFGIGVPPRSLSPWCDEVHAVTDLTDIDGATAETLFGR